MKPVPIKDSSEKQNNRIKFQTFYIKYKTHIINIFSLLLFSISFFLYIKSLEGCYQEIYKCIKNISFFFYIGYLIFFSAALMSIILEMTIFFKKWYFIFYFLPFINIFLKYNDNTLIEHGWYNFICFMFFFTFDFLLIKIINIYIFLIKKKIYKIININNYKYNNLFVYKKI